MKILSAVCVLILLGWYVPFWSHTLSSDERSHVKHAVEFIEKFRASRSRLPSVEEFLRWGKQEDLQGATYDGKGFTFRENCFPLKAMIRFGPGGGSPPYCLYFWTGDVGVAYWSRQRADDIAVIDDSGGIVVVIIVYWALLFALIRVFQPKAPEAQSERTK